MIQILTLVFTFLITLNSQSLDDQSLVQTCIYLSRYYARDNQQEIIDVIQSYSNQDDQKSIWSKLYIVMVSKCAKTMTFQHSYQIFEDMKNQKFQFEDHLWHFADVQFQDYKWGKISLQLSEKERATGQMIESFEKSLQEHQEQQEQLNKQQGGEQSNDQSVEQELKDYNFQLQEVIVIGSIMFVLVFFIYIGCCTKSNTSDSNKREKKQKKVNFQKTDENQGQQRKVNSKKTDEKQE